MPSRPGGRSLVRERARAAPRKRRRRRSRWLSARTRRRARRALRAYQRATQTAQLALWFVTAVAMWAIVNGIYQVLRKPTELFFPVSGTLAKTPSETWSEYHSIFRAHSTGSISPELLAALAQVEASGNPIARTYWRWSWRLDLFEVYRPASSAVGMYQITDGTFDEARRYCIHDHVVVEDGPWHDFGSCWFNALYFRVVPSHAVELTSAYLDRAVARILGRHGVRGATSAQKQRLAALIHLCGAGVGDDYARRGLRLSPGLRCGDHSAGAYVARVENMQRVFARLAKAQ